MAIDFAGMFADPTSFRDERLKDLMQQRAGISQMGGSMNQLLGQVAAGGGATGAQLAEGIGGMFGLQTREEAQAQKVQDMAKMIDMNQPEDLNQFAMALNDMGMTKEAVMVLEKRQAVLDKMNADADRSERIAKGDIRQRTATIDVNVPRFDSKGQLVGYFPEKQTVRWDQTWNPKTQKWEPENPPSQQGSSSSNGAPVRMPAGKTVTATSPSGKKHQIDTNTMTNSENKPMSSLADSLRLWWEGL